MKSVHVYYQVSRYCVQHLLDFICQTGMGHLFRKEKIRLVVFLFVKGSEG